MVGSAVLHGVTAAPGRVLYRRATGGRGDSDGVEAGSPKEAEASS